MTSPENDITRMLISSKFIYDNIWSMFPDAIFINSQFEILGMSDSIQQSLGFTNQELTGQQVNTLEKSGQLQHALESKLKGGFFSKEEMTFISKEGNCMGFSVSGFYLGLLSDFSGLIVLRLSNDTKIEEIDRQLSHARMELDNFIYRTAHDLRGPLATIEGLVNLLKIRKDDTEINRFIDLIDSHAKTLDERLHQLLYIAEVEHELEEPTYFLNFHELETDIRKLIEKNAFIDFLELNVKAPVKGIQGINEIQLRSIISNIILYFLSLPKIGTESRIDIHAYFNNSVLKVVMSANGFISDENIPESIQDSQNFMYSDLMKHSKLTNLFAAQKIALKFKSMIKIESLKKNYLEISFDVPRTSKRKD